MGFAAAIGLGLTAAGTASQVVANNQAAKGAEAQHSFNRRQHLVHATFARQRAADAISRGSTEVAKLLGEGEQIKGAQRAAFAGRNIEVGTGTAKQVVMATDLITSADALVIRENARREAQGHLIDEFSSRSAAAAPEPPGATMQNVGTILGGASQFTNQLFNWRQQTRALNSVRA